VKKNHFWMEADRDYKYLTVILFINLEAFLTTKLKGKLQSLFKFD